MPIPIRVVILDAWTIYRRGVRLILENQPRITVVGDAGDSSQGVKVVADQKPDIILLNINPPGDLDLDVIAQLIKTWNHARIILMVTTDDVEVRLHAIKKGVLGFVHMQQSPEILVKAIETVHAGELWIKHSIIAQILKENIVGVSLAINQEKDPIQLLSDRERQVIQLIGRGYKNQQIAIQLSLSESTVGHHLTSIYNKLGVSDRMELLIFAHNKGLATEPK